MHTMKHRNGGGRPEGKALDSVGVGGGFRDGGDGGDGGDGVDERRGFAGLEPGSSSSVQPELVGSDSNNTNTSNTDTNTSNTNTTHTHTTDTNNDNDNNNSYESRRDGLLALLPPQLRSSARWEFTPSREALEKASLSDRERAEAHADLFGIGLPGTDDPGARDVRLREAAAVMDDALDCIPFQERGALSRAREAFPFLFVSVGAQSTSHVRVFLEAEEYDVGRAARRMVRYWSERERQFGEAAFSPDAFSGPADEDVVRMIQRRLAKSSTSTATATATATSTATMEDAAKHGDELSQLRVLATIQDFQSRRLREIDVHLHRLPPKARKAWEDARSTRPDLADTDAHKIIFLHCCDYDPRKAARRLANYWDMKYFLFGKDRAFRSLRASELLGKERDEGGCKRELEEGVLHLLPGTDQSGRGVLVLRADKMMRLEGIKNNRIGVLRAAWYMLHAAQHDEKTWLNGLVIVIVNDTETVNGFDYHFFLRVKTVMYDCVPLKTKAIHDCVLVGGETRRSYATKRWLSVIFSVIKLVLGRGGRQRYWPHLVGSGKHELEQVVVNFEACGISREHLPTVLGGTLDEETYVAQFLHGRRDIEEQAEHDSAAAAAAAAAGATAAVAAAETMSKPPSSPTLEPQA